MIIAAIVAVGIAILPAVDAARPPGPGEAVVRHLIDSIKKLSNAKDPEQRRRILDTVNQSLAISAVAKASLGEQWNKIDEAERGRFVALLTKTLEKFAYPRAAQALSTVNVEFGGEQNQGARRLVRTKIARPEGGQMAVDYLVAKAGSRFKVIDVDLDGQSLSKVVTERIQQALKRGGYEKLVADLEKRAATGTSGGSTQKQK